MGHDHSTLGDLFLQHHKQFTRGLHNVLKLLQSGEVRAAVEEGDRLDQLAGPHIEFEEESFYPQVAKKLGDDFVQRLYDEHQTGQKALKTLLQWRDRPEIPAEERDQLVRDIQIALDHATSCGTLLSHLTTLRPEEQNQFTEQLLDFNQQGHRWTELPERSGPQ